MKLPIAVPLESRDGVSNKDSRYTNTTLETETSGKVTAQNRPGISLTASNTGNAGGLVSYDGRLISVVGVDALEVGPIDPNIIYYFPFATDLLDTQGNIFEENSEEDPIPPLPNAGYFSPSICNGLSTKFDGVDCTLMALDSTPCNILTSDFTMEFYIFCVADNFQWLIQLDANNYCQILVSPAAHIVQFNLLNGGASLAGMTPYVAGVTAGVWKHIAVCRSGSTFRMFVDGAVVASSTSAVAEVRGGNLASSYVQFLAVTSCYLSNLMFTRTARYTAAFSPSCNIATPVTSIGTVAAGFYDFAQGTT